MIEAEKKADGRNKIFADEWRCDVVSGMLCVFNILHA